MVLFEFAWRRENFMCKLLKLMCIFIELVVLLGVCSLGARVDSEELEKCVLGRVFLLNNEGVT